MPPDQVHPPPGERLTFTEESEPVPAGTVTLVEGATFAICDRAGNIVPGSVQGLFVADTRVCSTMILTVDGASVEALTVVERSPFEAMFVGRSRDRELLVLTELHVGRGMRIDLRVENLTPQHRSALVELTVRTDLADLFAVKEGRARGASVPFSVAGGCLTFADAARRRGLLVRPSPGSVAGGDGRIRWRVDLHGRADWQGCVELAAIRGGEEIQPTYRCGERADAALPSKRQARWHEVVPRVRTDVPALAVAFQRAEIDLGGLRIFEPEHPDDPLIAAGAPWFMTLFGRDSILTSWMALLLDPTIGLSTARALARLQGRCDDPATEEEPGRILHEVRFSAGTSLALADGEVYYGSVDATPLFVMLVHELWRWGIPLARLVDLLPAVDAALGWMAGPGDRDGDGYIEYQARSPRSLVNQGWKDSFDGVSFADGRLPSGPIALAEVQAYAFGAWVAGAALAAATGDQELAHARLARAEALQARFERDFWMPEAGAFAIALDGDKRVVDAIASNMGHCLWTGIVRDRDQAAGVARWLTSPGLFSGWGVRTLATSMQRYNPLSYHNGSVWPHDTAICIAGLRRAGFADEALTLAGGLLAAAGATGGRLPELFAGLGVRDVAAPVPYPASCSPQAWAAASPLLVVRALLGLEPDLPSHSITVDPVLPPAARHLSVVDVPIGAGRMTIEVDGDALAVRGLPREIALLRRSS